MDKRIINSVAYVAAAIVAMVGLWLTSRHSYLLFHSLAELFSIAVAGAMFAVAWNSSRFSTNGYLTYVGIAYLSVAGLDLVHTLAFKGLGVFPAYGANLPTQLWIAARGMEALSLLIAPVFLLRRVRPWPTLLSYLAVTAALLAVIFLLDAFPTCYVEGGPYPGLTPFKIGAEYIICLVLLASIASLWAGRQRFSPNVLALITAAIWISILSELAFTRYVSVYGDFNMVGHLLKVISFLLLYKATVEATLKDPYQVLFRDLNQREEALRESEGRYRTLFEKSLDAVIVTDPSGEGTILSANPAACRMFGRTEQEMIGLSRDDMFAPHQPELASLLKERERVASYTGELTYRRADGTAFPGEVSTSFFTDSNGNLRSVAMVRDITERKQAEEALRDSERLYRAIGESMDYGVWVCAPDGRNTYASESFLRMVGITQEQCSNFGWGDVLHPDDAERTIARWKECVKTGGTWDIEHRFRGVDGQWHPVLARGVPVKNEHGEIKYWAGINLDMSRIKQAEEARRQSEEHYRSLFENMLNGFAYCKMLFDQDRPKDFIYLNVNSAFEVLTGLKNVTGRKVSEVIPGIQESDPELLEIYGRVALAGVPERFERYVEALGMWFSISVYSPQKEYFVAVFDVITERKRAEEALQKAHDELEQRVRERTDELQRQAELLNLTHDAIIARDLNQRVFFWNRGAEERYGWPSDEVKGKVTDDLLQTVFPRPGQEIEQELLLRGRWEGEVVHTTRDGRKVTVTSRRALRRDRDGKPIAILEINSDITEQKRIEEHLRQSQKMEAVGTLAGGIAHDFNNILAAIIGFTEMVLDDVSDNPFVHQKMERVLKAGFRGRDLVRQILTYSRRSDEEKKALHLSPLIQETFKLLRSSIPTTIEMKLDLDDHRDLAYADPSQMQQIIMNLCTNASHAMREKGGTLEVSLRAISIDTRELLPEPDMAPGDYLVLSVGDTGLGMDDRVMKRIFEPFFTTKEKGQGTGLGLSVVYGIVKSHKGGIRVSSRPGQGSVFSVYLPAAPAMAEAESEIVSWDTLPTGTERILLVDDEEPIVELGQGVLRRLGYTVVAKRSGREALETFIGDGAFDLIITDQTMPEMTGVMLAAELLKLRPDLPVILCTGYSESVSRETAQEVGIREFLMKPLSKRELAGAVRRAIERNT